MKMNKRIGVISIWDIDNYGNRLQNYALLSALRSLGYSPYTLKMWPQKKWKRIFQYLTNYDVSWMRLVKEKLSHNYRKYNFLCFERKHITKDRHFYDSTEDKVSLNRKYDAFIVGSDQIWNPVFLEEPYYFAAFADKDKTTISYAASMGVGELDYLSQEKLKNGLKTIKYVSVREERAAEIIEALDEPKPAVVIDPTMLISADEWQKLEKKPDYIHKDYILLYYLGDISEERWSYLQKISNENNLDIIILGKKEYPEYYQAGPSEFLYLIHHAKLMCTDSFHGCVFSILFQTPFYVFERENSLQKMNSRIDTLLNIFHLENRTKSSNDVDYSLECDFTQCERIIEEKKSFGMNFLKKSLSNLNIEGNM